jgi:ferredoxin
VPMADMATQPTNFDVDWFFLWPYWLMSATTPLVFWGFVLVVSFLSCYLPYLVKSPPILAAEVVDNKCVGCNLCSVDCPYAAIEMVPAPAGSRFKLLATVKPYRCSGCGVCVGACAFDAIDLPDLLDTDVTARIKAMAAQQA